MATELPATNEHIKLTVPQCDKDLTAISMSLELPGYGLELPAHPLEQELPDTSPELPATSMEQRCKKRDQKRKRKEAKKDKKRALSRAVFGDFALQEEPNPHLALPQRDATEVNEPLSTAKEKLPTKKFTTKTPLDPWSAPGVLVDKMVWNHLAES